MIPATGWLRRAVGFSRASGARSAFSLVELLAVVAIVAVLASLLLPTLTYAKRSAQSTRYKNNLKQLQLAWLNYAEENADRLVPNKSRNIGLIQRSIAPSWVLGNAKWDTSLTNLQGGLLYRFGAAERVFRCPADKTLTKGRGSPTPRLRSYSLSVWLGGDLVGKGMQGNTDNEPRFKARLGAIAAPSRTFAFLDEHQDSIDDGLFGIYDPKWWNVPHASPELRSWLELPADRSIPTEIN